MCVWDTCGSEEEFAGPRLTTDCGPQNLGSDTKEGDCDVVVNDTLDESNESDPSVEPVVIQRNASWMHDDGRPSVTPIHCWG